MAECRGKAKFLIIWKLPEATAKPKKKKKRKKERKKEKVGWSGLSLQKSLWKRF